ncbi:MAG: TlpA disulfide reductase family protein [Ginsengibacter sp.]
MKIIQFLFFLFSPLLVFPQTKELRLPLNFHNGSGPFDYINFFIKWDDTSIAVKNTYVDIKGIPSNLRNVQRAIIWFNPQQYVYQNYISGKLSRKVFLEIKNEKNSIFNEIVLSKNVIKCFVNVITGINEKNEKVCIVDANNDYDFSNDTPFIPLEDSTSDGDLNKHLITVQCQRVLDGKIVNDKVPLLIVKSGNYTKYSLAQYATVTLNIGKKNYELAVSPAYFYARTWHQAQLVLLTDSLKTKKAGQDLIINNDGFITIGSNIYKFNKVDITKNLLTLQKMSNSNQYSSQVGFHAPLFKSTNLLTEKNISLVSYKGKFILIDFWGTWCHPCRQQLPELIKLNNSVDSSRFVLISIASLDSLDNLKKVIALENMTWPQIFSDKITSEYHVSAFPTNLLINPDGVIIAKDLSMDDLKQKLSRLALLVN